VGDGVAFRLPVRNNPAPVGSNVAELARTTAWSSAGCFAASLVCSTAPGAVTTPMFVAEEGKGERIGLLKLP
jgi:hypothetical protein